LKKFDFENLSRSLQRHRTFTSSVIFARRSKRYVEKTAFKVWKSISLLAVIGFAASKLPKNPKFVLKLKDQVLSYKNLMYSSFTMYSL